MLDNHRAIDVTINMVHVMGLRFNEAALFLKRKFEREFRFVKAFDATMKFLS